MDRYKIRWSPPGFSNNRRVCDKELYAAQWLGNTKEDLEAFMEEHGLQGRLFLDENPFTQQLEVVVTPGEDKIVRSAEYGNFIAVDGKGVIRVFTEKFFNSRYGVYLRCDNIPPLGGVL